MKAKKQLQRYIRIDRLTLVCTCAATSDSHLPLSFYLVPEEAKSQHGSVSQAPPHTPTRRQTVKCSVGQTRLCPLCFVRRYFSVSIPPSPSLPSCLPVLLLFLCHVVYDASRVVQCLLRKEMFVLKDVLIQ